MEGCGALRDCRYLLHDRDSKFLNSWSMTALLKSAAAFFGEVTCWLPTMPRPDYWLNSLPVAGSILFGPLVAGCGLLQCQDDSTV